VPGTSPETWVIFSEELRRYLRSKWYIISTVAVVLLLILFMFLMPVLVGGDEPAGGVGENLERIGLVDESGQFAALGSGTDIRRPADRAEGLQAVARGEIDWLYVLPSDYMQTGAVEQYGEFMGRFPSNAQGEGTMSALLVDSLLAGRVDSEVKSRVLGPATFQNYRVAEDGSVSKLPPIAEAVGGLLVPIMFAALLVLSLTVGSANMVQSVAEEKESRVVEVTITSASPFSIMAGKLLALGTVGLVQAAVWIIAAALTIPVMFDRIGGIGEFTVSPGMWLTIICCFVAGYFLLTALAILVGAIAPSVREAGGMATWLTLIGWVPIWFLSILMMAPDGLLSRLLSYFPFTAPSGILARLAVGGNMAAWKIALALIGVVVMGAIVLWISARVFRAAILMRGQTFGARNLWAALRSAE
jgi:ABC-2 type transport system permease protein